MFALFYRPELYNYNLISVVGGTVLSTAKQKTSYEIRFNKQLTQQG